MSIYLNLAFVWGPKSWNFEKPECCMINVLKIYCGLIPTIARMLNLSLIFSRQVSLARQAFLITPLGYRPPIRLLAGFVL